MVDGAASVWDLLLLGVILISTMWGMGSYGLYEPHEAHFAGVGREMLTRNDWITPHLNGGRYLTKPPLLYWMVATSYSIFGIAEGAARLPLSLIGFSGILLAWQWARQLWGIRAARAAAVMLTVSFGWYIFSHQLMIDALLSVIFLAQLYTLWRALCADRAQSGGTRRWWLLFHASTGLSIMAKGPLGLGFAILMLLACAIWLRDWRLFLRCHPVLGLAIMIVIVAPWATLIEMRNPGYLRYVIENENLKRVVDKRWPPDYSGVKVSWLGFLGVTAIWMAPWILVLPQVLSFGWKNMLSRKPASDEGGRWLKAQPDAGAQNTALGVMVLLIGSALPVLLFLPIPARLIYYSLPAVPPMMLLVAGWWNGIDGDCFKKGRWAAALLFALAGIAVFVSGFILPEKLAWVSELMAAPHTIEYIPRMAFLLGLGLFFCAIALALRRSNLALGALGSFLIAALAVNVYGFSAFDNVMSSKRLVQRLDPAMGDDCIWVSEGSAEIGASAGLAYYLGQDKNGKARTVLIMSDDSRRPPPAFPPPAPDYLLDLPHLNELWQSGKPVLFVTDFKRSPKDWGSATAPRLPDNAQRVDFLEGGFRRVYFNRPALERLLKSGLKGDQ